ncbi:MAG: hypothetical protein BGP05_20670 [Rhizobiales bacterium 62-47]|nr:hypothetical protein [Hyphomicrobiales bacterium]OJY10122.1 MAG: hypothetical protein BGP05_20670 [Rhizobiales bacterium 62-47]
MNKLVTVAALLLLASGSMAIAQTGQSRSSSPSVQPGNMIGNAPVGHRQPRRSDVGSEKDLSNPNDPLNREDAALDRKIKSICRGC